MTVLSIPAKTVRFRLLAFLSAGVLLLSAGCATAPATDASFDATEAAPVAMACPAEVPAGTSCLTGRDSMGALYLIAMPAPWNGRLVLHAHGGPSLGEPKIQRSVEDLQRWVIMVKAGYAWAGSTFRQGGVAVRAAAEDTERLRRIFVMHVARPQLTILHGQSWGASVAAVGAEMFTDDHGRRPYDAVLLSSGVLGGGSRSYDFRLDLRVVYQSLCGNHPRADEAAYPLWMGLPPGATLTSQQLRQRVDDCLGLDKPAAQRSPEQARKLKTITGVLHLPARSVHSHLSWATWTFQDIVQNRTDGANPFGNVGAVYAGSDDDAALNRSVLRYRADPAAAARFALDTDPTGRIPVPVLTVHAIDDPTAFVELESVFKETVTRAGTADHVVQTFTDDHEHSYLTDPACPTLMSALVTWAQGGPKPTPQSIADQCRGFEAQFGPGCRFVPGYTPAPLDQRITPRDRR